MTLLEDRPATPPAETPRTVLPVQLPRPDVAPAMRQLSGFRRDDLVALGGAGLSAVATGFLIFGRLAPVAGILGQVVVTYLLFLGIYAFVVSVGEDRPAVVDKLMAVVLATGGVIALVALTSVVLFTFIRGWGALVHLNVLTEDMGTSGPLDPVTKGGVKHAIFGTLIIIGMALMITLPFGLACAVFLNETRSRAVRLVRTVVDAMTALPSVLAGLFIFATWILTLGNERSGLAAALAVSITMLPIVIRSSDVVLRLVPGNLREAAAALGAPQWRTVWHVVLPTARSGLATAVILGVARGVGETAPVLLTSGLTQSTNLNPLKGPMMSLPLATYDFARSAQDTYRERGLATAAVLMVLVLVLFTLARVAGGRPPGRVSRRGARRLAARSQRDAQRIDARHSEVA